jgi:hypothetical protein
MKEVVALLVFACVLVAVAGGRGMMGKMGKATKSNEKDERSRPLLPKVLPSKDNRYLLEFVVDEEDSCQQMEPVVRRLEEEFDTKVFRISINRRSEFYTLLESIGFNECGNVPFFYNRRTAQAICGPTGYKNLATWARGKGVHQFNQPPTVESFDFENRRSDIGMKGFLQDKFAPNMQRQLGEMLEDDVKLRKGKKLEKKKNLSAAERTAMRRQERAEKRKAKLDAKK